MKGTPLHFQCEVKYAGDFAPVFTFYDSNLNVRPSNTTEQFGLVVAMLVILADVPDNELSIVVTTSFADPSTPEGGVPADNSPDYKHVRSFPRTTVHCKYFLLLSISLDQIMN